MTAVRAIGNIYGMNTPRIYAFAIVIGILGIVGSQDNTGIPVGIRLAAILLAFAGVVAIVLLARRKGDPRIVPPEDYQPYATPPPPPPPPPPASAVTRLSPADKGRSSLSRTLLGVTCPECGYRFSRRSLPGHVESAHRLRLLED